MKYLLILLLIVTSCTTTNHVRSTSSSKIQHVYILNSDGTYSQGWVIIKNK